MKHKLAAGLIVALSFCALPVWAEPQQQPGKDPQALASEGLQSLLQAMELMLLAIPQFEAPVINENGDIIIRRKNPSNQPGRPAPPAPESKGKAI